MVFEESVFWKRKNEEREGPYWPNCFDDKNKDIHLTPGATKGTYYCGICQNGFTTAEYNQRRRPGTRRRWKTTLIMHLTKHMDLAHNYNSSWD
jgi:hypothetical protein